MRVEEQVLQFDCHGERLLGVLSRPEDARRTIVVIVVGGPQYRIGSHRQFVMLARALAAQGHAVLRFDCRGMGDSSGEAPGFEAIEPDIGAAISASLSAVPGADQVALWGLCDGASSALLYMDRENDPRVKGMFLINPWVRSEQTLDEARVKHYYRQRLLEREFWQKLLSGGLSLSALSDFIRSAARLLTKRLAKKTSAPSVETFQSRMLRAWLRFESPISLVLSERDLTAQEFQVHTSGDPAWQRALAGRNVQSTPLAGADHTFSDAASREQVLALTLTWLDAVDHPTLPWATGAQSS